MKTELLASLVILLISGGIGMAQEVETDDVASGATDLGTIGAEGGAISFETDVGYPGDIDWFKFTVDSPIADLVISSDSTMTLRLIAYDGNLGYLDDELGNLKMKAEAGTYFVRVDSIYTEIGNYSIAISTVSSESEPNDCITEGTILGPLANTTMVSGSIDPMADTDFFLFEIGPESEDYIEITGDAYQVGADGEEDLTDDELDWLSVSSYLSLVLYSYNESEGSYLPIDSGDGEIGADLSPGRYALRAQSGTSDPISDYVITFSFLNLECDDEPNDSPEEAVDLGVLTAGSELTADGCILPGDDVDYYVIVVEEAQEVVIETSGDSAGDSYLYLYDDAEEIITSDDDNGDGAWSMIEVDLDPGTYYIDVQSFWGEEMFQYTLTAKGA